MSEYEKSKTIFNINHLDLALKQFTVPFG